VTMREMLRATANYMEKGHGSFGRDRAASLRALADRMDVEMAKRPEYEWRDGMMRRTRELDLLARLDAAPSQSGDAK